MENLFYDTVLKYSKVIINVSTVLILGFSALAFYISLKNRRNAIREQLHNRQVNLLLNINKSIYSIYAVLDDYLSAKEEEKKDELKSTLKYKMKKHKCYLDESTILFPNDMVFSIYGIASEFNDLIALKTMGKKIYFTADHYISYEEKFKKITNDLRECIRDFIGIDKLSQENETLIKSKY